MKKVVSIAVFGNGDKYRQYLTTFVLAHLNLFPREDGWMLRIHHDAAMFPDIYFARTAAGRLLARLVVRGLVELVSMGEAPLTKAMLWRLAPVFDSDAGFVFCRDLDALPMPRDRACMEQFMVSKAAIGTTHDNLAHTGMMGGLCQFYAPAFLRATGFTSLEDVYRFGCRSDDEWSVHGTDQHVLNMLPVRFPQMTLLEHRFNGWTNGQATDHRRESGIYNCQAFSTPTPDKGYVWTENSELNRQADRLGAHLGCAGYDHFAARRFWEEHGLPEITAALRECEL